MVRILTTHTFVVRKIGNTKSTKTYLFQRFQRILFVEKSFYLVLKVRKWSPSNERKGLWSSPKPSRIGAPIIDWSEDAFLRIACLANWHVAACLRLSFASSFFWDLCRNRSFARICLTVVLPTSSSPILTLHLGSTILPPTRGSPPYSFENHLKARTPAVEAQDSSPASWPKMKNYQMQLTRARSKGPVYARDAGACLSSILKTFESDR